MACKHCGYSRKAYYLDEETPDAPEVCYVRIGDYCKILQEVITPGDKRQQSCEHYRS